MAPAAYQLESKGRIHVFDAAALPWHETPDAGIRLKAVRYDDDKGLFLGLVSFAPMARSGLHQHRGVATSFVIDGGLTDHQGSLGLHDAGINLAGATHDAVAYQQTLLVSRLEGPVWYAARQGTLSGLHAGSRHAAIVPAAPELPPDINVRVDGLPQRETGVAGLRRQSIFDYAGTGSAHRFVQLALRPATVCPPWQATALTEFWIRGGAIEIGGRTVDANHFVVIEAGATVAMASSCGALLLAWAEGPPAWSDGPATSGNLFGF